MKSKCTTSKDGRRIYRNNFKEIIETMQIRIIENPSMCQQRKSIVEHPFGTLKHTMGHRYFLMKGKEKVTAENEYVGIGLQYEKSNECYRNYEQISYSIFKSL